MTYTELSTHLQILLQKRDGVQCGVRRGNGIRVGEIFAVWDHARNEYSFVSQFNRRLIRNDERGISDNHFFKGSWMRLWALGQI